MVAARFCCEKTFPLIDTVDVVIAVVVIETVEVVLMVIEFAVKLLIIVVEILAEDHEMAFFGNSTLTIYEIGIKFR